MKSGTDVESEHLIFASGVREDDYLSVGHGWWGKVKRADRHERLDVVLLTVGGMEFPVVLLPHWEVTVRRGVKDW